MRAEAFCRLREGRANKDVRMPVPVRVELSFSILCERAGLLTEVRLSVSNIAQEPHRLHLFPRLLHVSLGRRRPLTSPGQAYSVVFFAATLNDVVATS